MYCSACGSPVTPTLKFCNRCGASTGKERDEEKNQHGVATGLITAVVFVALFGLGIMFAGAIALKQGAGLGADVVALFMLFAFAIIGIVEVFLLRQLSRFLGQSEKYQPSAHTPLFQPALSSSARELQPAPARTLAEPVPSVTENTTRTLEHATTEYRR
jgi:hypothetical protein